VGSATVVMENVKQGAHFLSQLSFSARRRHNNGKREKLSLWFAPLFAVVYRGRADGGTNHPGVFKMS
jgi:hypothetical protein